MSYEAFGDDDANDGFVTEERAEEAFILGAQAAREMTARFIEQSGEEYCDKIAASIRKNWHPDWGQDPGKLDGEIPKGAF